MVQTPLSGQGKRWAITAEGGGRRHFCARPVIGSFFLQALDGRIRWVAAINHRSNTHRLFRRQGQNILSTHILVFGQVCKLNAPEIRARSPCWGWWESLFCWGRSDRWVWSPSCWRRHWTRWRSAAEAPAPRGASWAAPLAASTTARAPRARCRAARAPARRPAPKARCSPNAFSSRIESRTQGLRFIIWPLTRRWYSTLHCLGCHP